MQIVAGQITVAELSAIAEATFGDLVKAVADIGRGLLAVNLPAEHGTPGFLEFDSMINLRPGHGNRTRSIEDPGIRTAIAELVSRVVVP